MPKHIPQARPSTPKRTHARTDLPRFVDPPTLSRVAPDPYTLDPGRDLIDLGVGVSTRVGGRSAYPEEYDAGR